MGKQPTRNIYYSRSDERVIRAVEELARRERRSFSKMAIILLEEALAARRENERANR